MFINKWFQSGVFADTSLEYTLLQNLTSPHKYDVNSRPVVNAQDVVDVKIDIGFQQIVSLVSFVFCLDIKAINMIYMIFNLYFYLSLYLCTYEIILREAFRLVGNDYGKKIETSPAQLKLKSHVRKCVYLNFWVFFYWNYMGLQLF